MDNQLTEKFRGKYRIPSARAFWWDYKSNAAYFITICTKNREHFFGGITNGQMELTEIGKIAEQEWRKTPDIRPDMNLRLDNFIVMPNHFHAILIIGENEYNAPYIPALTACNPVVQTACNPVVQTPCNPVVQMPCMASLRGLSPQSKNLPSIMRGFKSAVTMRARRINPDFSWHPRYYDHIIRDGKSYNRIATYITNNPKNWGKDKFRRK